MGWKSIDLVAYGKDEATLTSYATHRRVALQLLGGSIWSWDHSIQGTLDVFPNSLA